MPDIIRILSMGLMFVLFAIVLVRLAPQVQPIVSLVPVPIFKIRLACKPVLISITEPPTHKGNKLILLVQTCVLPVIAQFVTIVQPAQALAPLVNPLQFY
jgi:hypothetical protein